MLSQKIVIPALLAMFCLTNVQAATCQLQNLKVGPLLAGKFDVFQAKSKHLDLRFSSASDSAEVDAFPEPPLTVIHHETGKQCQIDGGIWVRKDVFVSLDEQVLMTHEYSGANDFLVFYNTGDCSKLHELDVSASKWQIKGSTIHIQQQDGKTRTRQEYPLNAHCLPQTTRK